MRYITLPHIGIGAPIFYLFKIVMNRRLKKGIKKNRENLNLLIMQSFLVWDM